MSPYLLLPMFLGLSVVVQGVLNRKIGSEWGLLTAVFLNATVLFVISSTVVLAASAISLDFVRWQQIDWSKFRLWFLVPGFCGFFLVLGIPWSLQNLGPSKTFIVLIASQICFSLVFEKVFHDASLGPMKLTGAALAIIGAVIVALN